MAFVIPSPFTVLELLAGTILAIGTWSYIRAQKLVIKRLRQRVAELEKP